MKRSCRNCKGNSPRQMFPCAGLKASGSAQRAPIACWKRPCGLRAGGVTKIWRHCCGIRMWKGGWTPRGPPLGRGGAMPQGSHPRLRPILAHLWPGRCRRSWMSFTISSCRAESTAVACCRRVGQSWRRRSLRIEDWLGAASERRMLRQWGEPFREILRDLRRPHTGSGSARRQSNARNVGPYCRGMRQA